MNIETSIYLLVFAIIFLASVIAIKRYSLFEKIRDRNIDITRRDYFFKPENIKCEILEKRQIINSKNIDIIISVPEDVGEHLNIGDKIEINYEKKDIKKTDFYDNKMQYEEQDNQELIKHDNDIIKDFDKSLEELKNIVIKYDDNKVTYKDNNDEIKEAKIIKKKSRKRKRKPRNDIGKKRKKMGENKDEIKNDIDDSSKYAIFDE